MKGWRSRSATPRRAAGTGSGTICAFGDGEPVIEAPRQGRRALLDTLALLRDLPAGGGGTFMGEALEPLRPRCAPRRPWSSSSPTFAGRPPGARRFSGSRPVTPCSQVEVRDPREQELADVGELRLVDPRRVGRQLRVDTGDRGLRERFAVAAADERAALVRALASVGVRHVALSTEGDWAPAAHVVPAPEGPAR